MNILSIFVIAGMLFSSPSPKKLFTFSGTVEYGDNFTKTLPNGLVFDLTASDCGWIINIHPPGEDDEEYVWPENPPIHDKNQLFLDDEYDGNWELPLKLPHTIFFARDARQAARQRQWIDAYERGDYKRAETLDSPQSAFGKLIFNVLSYRKQKVEKKMIANSIDSYCADDLRFRVSVSNF